MLFALVLLAGVGLLAPRAILSVYDATIGKVVDIVTGGDAPSPSTAVPPGTPASAARGRAHRRRHRDR